jgi:hypothetical protein
VIESPVASCKDRYVEVDDQPDATSGEFQVRDHLRRVNWSKTFDGLDLDNDAILDEKIQLIAALNPYRSVHQGHGHLSRECDPALKQLVFETCLVRRLEQAWAKHAMYFDCGTDYGLGDLRSGGISIERHARP